jgi:transposase
MGKSAIAIELTAAERAELAGLAGRRRTAQGLARRARIVLAAAEGTENKAIAQSLGADENTVGKWRRRFAERRLDGLYDEPRSGAPRRIADEEIAEIVRLTLETTPPEATHWSLRSMAAAVGHAPSTVQRIWKAFCLQPHRSETFKLSTDPLFVDKSLPRRRPGCGILSGFIWRRPSAPWCCASTRNRKSKRSTALSR